MLHLSCNASAIAAQMVISRSSRFLLAGVAAMLCGLWSLPAAAQGGHLPLDVSGLLLDASVCWSFQGSSRTTPQLAAELNRYTEQQLAKGHASPVSVDRSGPQPVIAVRVFAHIDYAKPVPCPSPPPDASVANNLKQIGIATHRGGKPKKENGGAAAPQQAPLVERWNGSAWTVAVAGGVTTTHRDGSLNFIDVISGEPASTGQSGSSTFGTFGVLGTALTPIFLPGFPDSQGFFETGFLFHTDSHATANFVHFSGNEATGQTATQTVWSVPLLAGVQIPVGNFGIPAPNVALQLKGGGMIDTRKITFNTFEVSPDLITSASVTKTQVNPAFGFGFIYAPPPSVSPFKFGVQTIFDFQQPISATVQPTPFPSAFYTVNSGHQLNTTVVFTASVPTSTVFATHFGLGF